MEDQYVKLFKTPVEMRIVERRTSILDALLRSIGLNEVRSVACEPQQDCLRKRCFVNVDQMIHSKGGEMITGWIFNEFRNRSIEGEPHAVWQTKGGKTIDVTPHDFQPKRVLFAPDTAVTAKRGYTAAPRISLSNDPRIIAIEKCGTIIDRLFEERFTGFGQTIAIYAEDILSASNESGLPLEVCRHLFDCKVRGMGGGYL